MPTQAEINAALAAELKARPGASYDALMQQAASRGVGQSAFNQAWSNLGFGNAGVADANRDGSVSGADVSVNQAADALRRELAARPGSSREQLQNMATSVYGIDPGVFGQAWDQMNAIKTLPPALQGLGLPQAPITPQQRGYDMQNPYLGQMANTITGQVNENLMRNVMPQINSAAVGAGQYGGSRQGVVQANALRDANQQLSNSLTGMYFGDYNNQMNRNLQQYGMDQGYNLGLGRLYEGARQFDEGFGLQKDQFGFNSALSLQNAFNNNANLGLTAASNIYNQPLSYWNQFANAANSVAGQGGVSNQNMPGNPLMGAYGGAMLGNQMLQAWGPKSYQTGGIAGAPTGTGSANFLAPY